MKSNVFNAMWELQDSGLYTVTLRLGYLNLCIIENVEGISLAKLINQYPLELGAAYIPEDDIWDWIILAEKQ